MQISKIPPLRNTLWHSHLSLTILTAPSLTSCTEFHPNVKFGLISWSHRPSRSSGPISSSYSREHQVTERGRGPSSHGHCSLFKIGGIFFFFFFLVHLQLPFTLVRSHCCFFFKCTGIWWVNSPIRAFCLC